MKVRKKRARKPNVFVKHNKNLKDNDHGRSVLE